MTIDRQTSVILVREQGKVWAMSLACPHEHAAVKWVDKEQKFRCTKHDSQYEATGKYLSGRSTRNLDRFPVRKDGDRILVTVDTVFRADQNAAGWAAAEIVL